MGGGCLGASGGMGVSPHAHKHMYVSQGLLGLCCSIETRDRIEIITITAVLFD